MKSTTFNLAQAFLAMYPAAVFDADFRCTYQDGEFELTVLNAAMPFNPTPEQVALLLLSAAQAAKWQAIKADRDRRTQAGGYQVGAKWYHSDTFSRTQQMGLVMLGANIPAGVQWKTMDGTFVAMTQALAGQIFGAAAASDIAVFAAAETHKAAMEASADPAAYDFSAGWPAIFGEQQ